MPVAGTKPELEEVPIIASSPEPTAATLGKPQWLTIGRLAPLVLVLWLVTDLGLRFLPPEALDIHPWQHARIGAGRFAPFAANLSLRSSNVIASAAITGNLQPVEGRVNIRFTTNSAGFRDVPGSDNTAPRVLTMGGSSFGYGYGLSDEHTLAAVLQRELGTPVFNAGRFFTDPDGLVELDQVLRQLTARPQAVAYLYLEQQDLFLRGEDNPWPEFERPPLESVRLLGQKALGPAPYRDLEERYLMLKKSLGAWLRLSPLEITVSRWQKTLADDRILPNSHKKDVTALELTNGMRILFDRYEWRRATGNRTPERTAATAAYLAWLKSRLQERGLEMYVVMVPDKASVYRNWLRGPADLLEPVRRSNSSTYMTALHSELVANGIKAVDGLAVLHRTAEQDVTNGRLAYYLDDSHWNSLGVERIGLAAARMIASAQTVSKTN